MKKFFFFVAALLLISCSSEKSGQEMQKSDQPDSAASPTAQAPLTSRHAQFSIEVQPANANRNSTLMVVTRGFNFPDAKIEWLVNDVPVSSGSPVFKAADTRKGDRIQARASIQGGALLSNVVQIKDTPPELTRVKIMPEVFKPGDTLYIDAAGSDVDGEEVTILYEWTKNGEPAGKGKAIGLPIKRGDKISVKITPFDGETYGNAITLIREIRNMPPEILDDKNFSFNGGVFTCQIKASDPDGDTLSYSLKAAPQAMTINPATGLITWNVPPEFKGKASFTVIAADGHGGESIRSFNVEIGQ